MTGRGSEGYDSAPMNFIEAALSLLEKSRRSLTAEQLAEKAEKQGLLSKPGANPQRSMKNALKRELKKGDASRVAQVGEDRWKSAATAKKATKKKAETGKKTTAKKTTAKKTTKADAQAEKKSTAKPDKKTTKGKKTTKKSGKKSAEAATAKKSPSADEGKAEAASKSKRTKKKEPAKGRRRGRGAGKADEAPAIEPPPISDEARADLGDLLAPKERPRRAAPPVTPADDELADIYGDELSGTEPGAAFAEYRDAQTADEDRPMTPEVLASRKDRQKRERRRKRRERHGKGAAEERTQSAPRTRAQPAARAKAAAVSTSEVPFYGLGSPLSDAAWQVLNSLDGQQAVSIKKLAEMMSKRRLLASEPDQIWPHLKAAISADERSRAAHGLPPRFVQRGRGQIALAGTADGDGLAQAEQAFADAAENLVRATHQAMKERLSGLDRDALERVTHVYLVRQGWRNLRWIKRVQRSSYALGEPPGGIGTTLVAVRAGNEPVDRRGVGELRVGVQAKNLASGLLIAPQALSDVARQELRRPGPSLSLLVGDTFVSALVQSGIGATTSRLPVAHIDDDFFRDLESA